VVFVKDIPRKTHCGGPLRVGRVVSTISEKYDEGMREGLEEFRRGAWGDASRAPACAPARAPNLESSTAPFSNRESLNLESRMCETLNRIMSTIINR